MIPIQPVLIAGILLSAAVYFSKLRSRLWDRLLVIAFVALSIGFITNPNLTTRLAHFLGVGRGVDLIFYFTLTGFAFLFVLLFSWVRELQQQVTSLARELALHGAGLESLERSGKGGGAPQT